MKNSDTLVIVIHEIYGVNKHIQSFCELLSKQNFNVICPNLLGRETPFDYSQEGTAYQYFMESIGFTNAVNKVKQIVSSAKEKYQRILIIGFSVGATVAWLCCEDERVNGIIGYYGSRIRNYAELTPICPTLLFFPEEEKSFHVDELISTLDKKNIVVHKFNGKHGFSDPYSLNYNPISAQRAYSGVLSFISERAN
ncbi:dienelactone hydrolase family protein [Bacillus massilinigeriensis]|uniref:dienelactone hydrolase family protein n=1 Tax=Bacillus mediterraneensis TaxID=1805474 RepID=UPI0008F84AF6|nr:dienelactone hydrolase family protein [Bacillus mediterraneensis]